jgi:hypothetical protein
LTLFKVLVGCLPFALADTSDATFFLLYEEKWRKFWSVQRLSFELSEDAKDFFQRALQYEPKRRLKLGGMKAHPWMAKPLPSKTLVKA